MFKQHVTTCYFNGLKGYLSLIDAVHFEENFNKCWRSSNQAASKMVSNNISPHVNTKLLLVSCREQCVRIFIMLNVVGSTIKIIITHETCLIRQQSVCSDPKTIGINPINVDKLQDMKLVPVV